MISEDPVLTELADANPVPRPVRPAAGDREQADRVLQRVLSAPPQARPRRQVFAPAAAALVTIAVVVAALSVLRSGPGGTGVPLKRGLQIVLLAAPTPPQHQVSPAALSHEAEIVRERLHSILPGARVAVRGEELVVTAAARVSPPMRARIVQLASEPGRLYFYDWEGNALTPNGKAVASQLHAQNLAAFAISQGTSSAVPGSTGSGGLPLYEAVKLAARQPRTLGPSTSRTGPQYYMFGAPGSSACAAEARAEGILPTVGRHCLLAGPGNGSYSAPAPWAVQRLASQLPPGVRASQVEVLVVQQGTVVLQAVGSRGSDFARPSARFFVLHDDVALDRADITNPKQSTDQSGSPDITFGFTASGDAKFQRVTAQIAHRGQLVSSLGQTLYQHFAIALDGRLLSVPSIDFKAYPDGIAGTFGADITGGFNAQSAKDIATELRYGPLPLQLALVH